MMIANATSMPASHARETTSSSRVMPATSVSLFAGIALLLFAFSAWHVRETLPFHPASGIGYALGIVGGVLMAMLLFYPVRKRFRVLQVLGPLKHWFRFHMVAGIAGPLSVLYHSTFHIGSFNAAIALYSMLLVVASGIVGRFIYRKIHNGLFGSRATLKEIQMTLSQQMEMLAPLLTRFPVISMEVERYIGEVHRQPATRLDAMMHFLSLGWRRLIASQRIHRATRTILAAGTGDAGRSAGDLRTLALTLDSAMAAAQKTAQFSTYERLFSLWHVVHIPFLWMLLFTAIAHVVAVHAY